MSNFSYINEFKSIRESIEVLEQNFRSKTNEAIKEQKEAERYKQIVIEFLKSKIGQKIYWAHKNWRKYETHTISGVSVEIQSSDFFGEEYVGKECIHIYVKGGGYFIADDIGKVLFFSEEEAALRSNKS